MRWEWLQVGSPVTPKLVELNNLAKDYCIFKQLEEVLDFLEGGYSGEYMDRDEEDKDKDSEKNIEE